MDGTRRGQHSGEPPPAPIQPSDLLRETLAPFDSGPSQNEIGPLCTVSAALCSGGGGLEPQRHRWRLAGR